MSGAARNSRPNGSERGVTAGMQDGFIRGGGTDAYERGAVVADSR